MLLSFSTDAYWVEIGPWNAQHTAKATPYVTPLLSGLKMADHTFGDAPDQKRPLLLTLSPPKPVYQPEHVGQLPFLEAPYFTIQHVVAPSMYASHNLLTLLMASSTTDFL
jgi:hypothetical protein